ncbi:TPA_asm: PolB [Synchytrium chytrid fungus MELD element]|nr:TPA_asm: PolB [Synchytrium chytrid fungus MELD element]
MKKRWIVHYQVIGKRRILADGRTREMYSHQKPTPALVAKHLGTHFKVHITRCDEVETAPPETQPSLVTLPDAPADAPAAENETSQPYLVQWRERNKRTGFFKTFSATIRSKTPPTKRVLRQILEQRAARADNPQKALIQLSNTEIKVLTAKAHDAAPTWDAMVLADNGYSYYRGSPLVQVQTFEVDWGSAAEIGRDFIADFILHFYKRVVQEKELSMDDRVSLHIKDQNLRNGNFGIKLTKVSEFNQEHVRNCLESIKRSATEWELRRGITTIQWIIQRVPPTERDDDDEETNLAGDCPSQRNPDANRKRKTVVKIDNPENTSCFLQAVIEAAQRRDGKKPAAWRGWKTNKNWFVREDTYCRLWCLDPDKEYYDEENIQKIEKATGSSIVIVQFEGNRVIRRSKVIDNDKEKKIFLLFSGGEGPDRRGHYDLITNICGYFGENLEKWCDTCSTAVKKEHSHEFSVCRCCGGRHEKCEGLQICPDCNSGYQPGDCYNFHLKKCAKHWYCRQCRTRYDIHPPLSQAEVARAHVCGTPKNSGYFMERRKPKTTSDQQKYVFFDIQTAMDQCIIIAITSEDDVKYQFSTVKEFVRDFVLARHTVKKNSKMKYQNHIFIGHDGARNHLQEIATACDDLNIKYCPRLDGNAIPSLRISRGNLQFTDSRCFLDDSLKDIARKFGFGDDIKDHFFIHPFHRNIRGPWSKLDTSHFGRQWMTAQEASELDTWFETKRRLPAGTLYDFEGGMTSYCLGNVQILKKVLLPFIYEFENATNHRVSPFSNVSLPATAMYDFRTNHLEENTIPLYHPPVGLAQSKKAARWLTFIQKHGYPHLQHRFGVAGEKTLAKGLTVDGFHVRRDGHPDDKDIEGTVFQYQGCFYHGCPQCFHDDRDQVNRKLKKTMRELYEDTLAKNKRIVALGYKLIEVWEHDAPENQLTSDDEIIFINAFDARDGYFGGRVETLRHLYEGPDPIEYLDVCSMFPWVMATLAFPVCQPVKEAGTAEWQAKLADQAASAEQLLQRGTRTDWDCFGLAHATVLPPKTLRHPVLPYRCEDDRVAFCLCRTCAENDDKDGHCAHAEADRQFRGVWFTPELSLALHHGYQIVQLHEMHHFPQQKTGIFKTYVDLWFAFKNGNHPILSTIAKLMLNAFYGKFGQKPDRPRTEIVCTRSPADVARYRNINRDEDITDIAPISTTRFQYTYTPKRSSAAIDPNTSLYIAMMTTSWARIRLYSMIQDVVSAHGDDAVLAYDTDGIMFVARGGTQLMCGGGGLGTLRNELTKKCPGAYGIRFASLGTKSYTLVTNKPELTLNCCSGISLNVGNAATYNFRVIKSIVTGEQSSVSVDVGVRVNIQHGSTAERRHRDLRHEQRDIALKMRINKKGWFDFTDKATYPFGYVKTQLAA